MNASACHWPQAGYHIPYFKAYTLCARPITVNILPQSHVCILLCHMGDAGATTPKRLMAMQKNNRMPFAADWYLLSDVSPHYESASANSTEGVFSASLQGKSTSPRYSPLQDQQNYCKDLQSRMQDINYISKLSNNSPISNRCARYQKLFAET